MKATTANQYRTFVEFALAQPLTGDECAQLDYAIARAIRQQLDARIKNNTLTVMTAGHRPTDGKRGF